MEIRAVAGRWTRVSMTDNMRGASCISILWQILAV
jgi:hypothetical protein